MAYKVQNAMIATDTPVMDVVPERALIDLRARTVVTIRRSNAILSPMTS
jgi:hypothetical protein